LIAWLKANPDKASVGIAGVGGSEAREFMRARHPAAPQRSRLALLGFDYDN
jgi:hypothetical protein